MEYHIFTQIHTFLIASSFFDSRYEFLLSKFCLILNFCQSCSTLRPFYLLKGSRNRKMNCQTLVDKSPRFTKKKFSQIGELSFSGGFRRFWAISSHSAPLRSPLLLCSSDFAWSNLLSRNIVVGSWELTIVKQPFLNSPTYSKPFELKNSLAQLCVETTFWEQRDSFSQQNLKTKQFLYWTSFTKVEIGHSPHQNHEISFQGRLQDWLHSKTTKVFGVWVCVHICQENSYVFAYDFVTYDSSHGTLKLSSCDV